MSIPMGRSILTLLGRGTTLRSTQLLPELPFGNLFASIYLTSPQQKICLTDVGRSFTGTSSSRSLISPTNRIGSLSSVSDTIKLDGLAALAAVESSNSRSTPPTSGGLNGLTALAAATAIVASSSSTDTSPTICEGEEIDDEDDEEVVLLSPSARQKNAEERQDLETLMDLPALADMPNQCPRLLNIYEGVKRHWDIVKDLRYKDGTYVYWNFPRLPWKERNKDSTDVLVADELHYDTIENAGSLQGRQHCATKMRSDKETICAKTWNWRKDMLGMDIFMKSIQLDFECFAYFAYKKPEDVMSDENLQIIRESYAENVLAVVEKECSAMCFSSTACLLEHAKWVHGSMKEMQAAYELNRYGYISADNSGKLAAAAHPCTFYNTMKNSPGSLETRVERTDTQGTNYRRLFPGHENDECNYNAGMFDTTSPAFKAAKAAARASSVLGGKIGGKTTAQRYWDAMEAIEDGRATLEDEVRVFTRQLVVENLKELNKERSDQAFQAQLDALVSYGLEHGNFDRIADEELSKFCRNMRYARKNPDSTTNVCDESRIDALDAVGFVWAPKRTNDHDFQAHLDALVAYKQDHDSFDKMHSNNKDLARFCRAMRVARKNPDSTTNVCDESRIAALDAVGFVWAPNDQAFQAHLDALEAYKQEHGNFDDMQSNDKKLANFCNAMRKARRNPDKKMKCDESRIAALDDIGFEWNPRNTQASSIIEEWCEAHTSHPYPTNEELQQLADRTSLDAAKVKSRIVNWRSRKWKRPKVAPTSSSTRPSKRRRSQAKVGGLAATLSSINSSPDTRAAIVTSGSDESSLDIDDVTSDDDMMLVDTADETSLSDNDIVSEKDEAFMYAFLKDSEKARVDLMNSIYEDSVKRGMGLMRPMPKTRSSKRRKSQTQVSVATSSQQQAPNGFHIAPCFCGNACQDCYDYQEQFRSKENPRKMIGGSTDRRNAAIAVGVAVGVVVASSVGRGTRV